MKWRWKISAAILVGLIANVVTAWSCAMMGTLPKIGHWEPPGDSVPERMLVPIPDGWRVPVHDPASQTIVNYTECARLGATAMLVEVWEQSPDQKDHPIHRHARLQVGWPMPSLGKIVIQGPPGTAPEVHGGISLPDRPASNDGSRPAQHRTLPVRVLPLGFIADTVFYAAVALVLYSAATLGLRSVLMALRWYTHGLKGGQLWQRACFKLAPCAVAGLVLSVAVAWTMALWSPIHPTATSQRHRISHPTDLWRARNYNFRSKTPGVWADGPLEPDGGTQGQPGAPAVPSGKMTPAFERMEDLDGKGLVYYERPDVCAIVELISVESGLGLRVDRMSLVLHTDPPTGRTDLELRRAGWPLYCASMRAPDWGGEWRTHGGIEPPQWLHPNDPPYTKSRWLPCFPLWLGLAFDTVFFGLVVWGAVFGRGSLRRRVRGSQGRCLKCNYDRRGLTPMVPCPECGTPRAPRID